MEVYFFVRSSIGIVSSIVTDAMTGHWTTNDTAMVAIVVGVLLVPGRLIIHHLSVSRKRPR